MFDFSPSTHADKAELYAALLSAAQAITSCCRAAEFEVKEMATIVRRGINWAARE